MAREAQEKYEAWGLTLNLTETKCVSVGKPEHNLYLKESDTTKRGDYYKYLGMKNI
jgi:hypothetical protein